MSAPQRPQEPASAAFFTDRTGRVLAPANAAAEREAAAWAAYRERVMRQSGTWATYGHPTV